MLRDIPIQLTYHKGRGKDDIANDFYLPAVSCAVSYDRAVGYFSSSIMLLAWPSLKQFILNGGKIRLLCSPVLSGQDEDAMRKAYSESEDALLANDLKAQFNELLRSPGMARPTTVLASMIANGVLDVKIAWVAPNATGRSTRIFHDKVGILTDGMSDRVAFKGSMNETWPALSIDGNIESIDVYCEWRDAAERERVGIEAAYFEEVWNGDWPDVVVKSLPESARSEIIAASDKDRWLEIIDDICLDLDRASLWSAEAGIAGGRIPRDHQVAALDAWTAAGRRGILEHATGSGKTFTALCALNASFQIGEVALVLVPSELLFKQWKKEIEETFAGQVETLLCGAGHDAWRSSALLRSWTRPRQEGQRPRIVLAMVQTASSPLFIGLCTQGDHLFLVADEVHRLGASEARKVLSIESGARLGLSATPRRAGDPEGTAEVLNYFRGVIPPPFTLKDAILSGALTPYAYHPQAVYLAAAEADEWAELTKRIRKAYAAGKNSKTGWPPGAEERFKMLLIQRARIAKTAATKVPTAVQILKANYRAGDRWIVYCDDQGQLVDTFDALRRSGLRDVYQYHSAMSGDPSATLAYFESSGGIVVSIRCLDEGVDIPSVSHALIMASSKNPREFIQRRGRVLRRSAGKTLAKIYDLLVLPSTQLGDGDDGGFDSIVTGEISRAIEFGTNAVNPGGVVELKRIAASFNIDWEQLVGAGEEHDDDETGPVEEQANAY